MNNLNMNNHPFTKIRKAAEPYIQKCKKCNHLGAQHVPEDHHDESRKRKTMGPIGKCRLCNCKKFVAH
jgi:hypothetical protein